MAEASAPAEPESPSLQLKTVARGGLANLLGAVVSAVANFALTVAVARGLGSERAGAFFALSSLFLVADSLCRLGADTGLIYFVARWRALDERSRVRAVLRTACTAPIVVGSCVGIVFLVFAPELAHAAGTSGPSAILLVRVLGIVLPVSVSYDLMLGLSRGLGQMRPTVIIDKIARPLLQLVFVLVVLWLGWKSQVGAAWALPYVAGALGMAAMLRGVRLPRGPALGSLTREFWSFSLPRAVAGVAQILIQRLDIILVAGLAGVRDAAIYTAATRFLVVGQFVNQAITAPVQPRLSALLARHDVVNARTLYRVSTTWLVLLTWPLFLLAIVFAPTYVRLFGRSFGDGTNVVILLSLAMLVANACGLVDSVVVMAGRTSWNLGTTVLALVVNVVVDLALIPHLGIIGAALGWAASIVAANVVPVVVCWRGLDLHPLGTSVVYAAGLSVVSFLALPYGVGFLLSDSQLDRLIGGLVGLVIFAAVTVALRRTFELRGLLPGSGKRFGAGRRNPPTSGCVDRVGAGMADQ